MATGAVKVHGLRDLNRTFKKMGKEVQKETRAELRAVGEPVRAAAEHLAVSRISHVGDRWSQMRLGVTTRLVYVAPKARSRRGSPRSATSWPAARSPSASAFTVSGSSQSASLSSARLRASGNSSRRL